MDLDIITLKLEQLASGSLCANQLHRVHASELKRFPN